ncbi:hypothetical protein BDV12DRAFT_170727 [Aspergillus spectabilis]
MAGMWPEQNENLAIKSSLKKRKRDTLQLDSPQPINNIRIIPSHLHNFDNSSHLDPLKYTNECSPRLPNLARKRRVLQQPCFYPPEQPIQSAFTQQFHPDSTQTKQLPSHTISLSANRGILSPPVSPKTSMPKISHQTACTSSSLLRPCHICHRRPTTKELLEAYADCDLCDQRACYICLRQCDAIDCCGPGHQQQDQKTWRDTFDSLPMNTDRGTLPAMRPRRICSCCAVEGITETGMEVVRCLACIE